MEGQIKSLYYQAYTLAYDLAKRAEKVFRFERGLTTSNFIRFGNWDIAHDGLFAGERLYVGLKQLEAAYQEKRGHDYEVSKSISLRQINPMALIELKETGTCEFALPEVLFDMDYPGQYLRRLKSVSLRIPCVIGPHTSLNCTLRLLEHKFRTNSIVPDKNSYPEQTDRTDERFSTVNVPISSIAVSSLEDESGVFELNFHDERYLPFEGAGAISKWRLELPDKFRQFDYDTITDVVMRLRYTSVDGGNKLKTPAAGSVQDYIRSVEDLSREEGLFAIFDLKNDFPNEWYNANHPPAGAPERVLTIDKLNEKLPIFTKGKNIQAKNIYLFVPASLSASITATQGGSEEISFTGGQTVGTMKLLVSNEEAPMGDLQIKIADTKTAIDKMWLLERYVLAQDQNRLHQ
jgi:Tc toxin complex TcA C-terminal TcB-binding domain